MLWIKFRSETRGYFQILVHTVHTEFAHQIWNVESINIMATKIIQRPPLKIILGRNLVWPNSWSEFVLGQKNLGRKIFWQKIFGSEIFLGQKNLGRKFFWVQNFRTEIWFGQILFCSYEICLCYVADYC